MHNTEDNIKREVQQPETFFNGLLGLIYLFALTTLFRIWKRAKNKKHPDEC